MAPGSRGHSGTALIASPLVLVGQASADDAAWGYTRQVIYTGAQQGYQMGFDPVNRKVYFSDAQARTDTRTKTPTYDADGNQNGFFWTYGTSGGSAKVIEVDAASKTVRRNLSYTGLTRIGQNATTEGQAHKWDHMPDIAIGATQSQNSLRTHFSPNGFAIDPLTTYDGQVDPTIITTHVRQQGAQPDGTSKGYGGGIVIFRASANAPTDADRLWEFDDTEPISDNSRRVAVNTKTHKAFITNMGTRNDTRRGYVTVIDLPTKTVEARIAIPAPAAGSAAADGGVIGVAVDEDNNYVYAGVIAAGSATNVYSKLFRIDASGLDTSNPQDKTLNASKVLELDAVVPTNARPFYSPGQKRLYVASYNAGIVSVIDADPASANYGKLITTINSGEVNHVTVDDERGLLYAAGLGQRVVKVYDTETFEQLLEIPTIGRANDLAVDPVTHELWVGYFSFQGASSTETEVFTVTSPTEAAFEVDQTSSVFGKAGKTSVVLTDAEGSALSGTVTLTGAGADQTATLRRGEASFTLPADLAVGTHELTFAYSGKGQVKSGEATTTHSVTKAATKVKATVSKKATTATKGKLKVTINGAVPGAAATGKVEVTLKKGKATKKVSAKLSNNGAVVSLPKLAKGTWNATVKYAGSASYKGAQTTVKVKVAKK